MKRGNFYSLDPRIITCKFNSYCHETGELIKKGAKAVYYPNGKQIFSMNSKQAYEFKCWKADIDLGHNY